MFRRFWNWLFPSRDERWRRDAKRAYEYAGKVVRKHEEVTPPGFRPHKPVEADGITRDNVPWVWIGGVKAGEWIETKPPYQIFVPRRGNLWRKDAMRHGEGHHWLGAGADIWNHDKRFDRYFWGWAYTRRMMDRVTSLVGKSKTRMKHVIKDGLLIDQVDDPSDQEKGK